MSEPRRRKSAAPPDANSGEPAPGRGPGLRVREEVFRKYDIRGVLGKGLDADVAFAVGLAFGGQVRRGARGQPRAAVGEDNRPSSPELADALESGLLASGVDVVRLGTVPTPVAYYAEHVFNLDAAVQITGSHNPPEFNGIKLSLGRAPFYGDRIQELRRAIQRGVRPAKIPGKAKRRQVLPGYVADIGRRFQLRRKMKVVVDCGNGAAAVAAADLLRETGAEVVPLYCESDGTFPNHHPDPTVDENLEDLIQAVRATKADLGVGFDGDADRIGVVDERGRVVRGDILILLFALDAIRSLGPNADPVKVVFDVKCSRSLPEELERAGGIPIMWKTGHSLIKEKMVREGAIIGGELSGHICFADKYLGFDDAMYAACRLTALLSDSERSLSEMVDAVPQYCSTPEFRIDVPEEEKFEIVRRAQEAFRETAEVIDIDGARIVFPGGWGLIRASNTQPVIAARYEAETPEDLAKIQGVIEDWLRQAGVEL